MPKVDTLLLPLHQLQPPPDTIEAPKTALEALTAMHVSGHQVHQHLHVLTRLLALYRQPPELRTVQINPSNNGNYQTVDEAAWPAKSIGILNPGAAPVFVGIGGVSARPNSGAPSCPGNGVLVLPVEAQDLEVGCDPAVLGATTAVVYIFRYVTVQPLTLALA